MEALPPVPCCHSDSHVMTVCSVSLCPTAFAMVSIFGDRYPSAANCLPIHRLYFQNTCHQPVRSVCAHSFNTVFAVLRLQFAAAAAVSFSPVLCCAGSVLCCLRTQHRLQSSYFTVSMSDKAELPDFREVADFSEAYHTSSGNF